jgi:hypothetical protein
MNMIQTFKDRINHYWADLKVHDAYNRMILEGTATPEMVSKFLVNIYYLVEHTPIHLGKAIKVAEDRGFDELAAFYRLKLKEEQGHDKWAEADFEKINKNRGNQLHDQSIDPTMKVYVEFIEDIIDQDPHLYLAYIFFAEYLCVICGPEMVDGLEQKCGFPAKSMTIIENHAELDKDHVNEWQETIASLVDLNTYEAKFLTVLDQTIQLHRDFFSSIKKGQLDGAA